ncbi:ATP-binding protein [Paenibacillus alkalitolerans]|uniref:ATP-binding protein n=1 Tax=Paenibacillus alkalitolerans TaxID=2799335 RepID=UPI0018F68FC7|nr:sensor histidine kinase [Paenibacillus alkalitolerans]
MKRKLGTGWTLQRRIALFTVSLVMLIIVQIAILTYISVSQTVETQIGNRALHVAKQVASAPEVRTGFQQDDPAKIIQPYVENVRRLVDAEFIVVGNREGIRYSHPIPERIGKEMVGGDNDRALLLGESYTSKARGSLGLSLRGKTPIFDDQGNIIGVVSVGFLLEDIHHITVGYGKRILWVACWGLVVGIVGAVLLARNIKKSMFGLEPQEISALYKVRDAVIQSIREGILVINKDGNIELLNQTAREILSVPKGKNVTGKPVLDYVPNREILEVLRSGQRQLDQESELGGKRIIVNRIPVMSGDEVIGVVSSFRLKSEIDQLTEELSQVQRYTEALRAQTHEFNNLLYTISGLIQLGAYEEALELIHKESSDTQDLIQFITNRIKAPWLGGILLGFMNRARELKVELILDRESSLHRLPPHVKNEYIVSILGNLVTNAFEAVAGNKEEDRKVRIFIVDIGDDILLEVEDSGAGIEENGMSRIFELGYTTKETGQGRRGYGLARVAELVQQLEGSIAIEKGELGGALFIVAIPKEVNTSHG